MSGVIPIRSRAAWPEPLFPRYSLNLSSSAARTINHPLVAQPLRIRASDSRRLRLIARQGTPAGEGERHDVGHGTRDSYPVLGASAHDSVRARLSHLARPGSAEACEEAKACTGARSTTA